MKRKNNIFGKNLLLTGQSAIDLIERNISEGYQSSQKITDGKALNLFGRFVHQINSTDLSFNTGMAQSGLRTGAMIDANTLANNHNLVKSVAERHLALVIHVVMTSSNGRFNDLNTFSNIPCFQLVGTNVQEAVDFSLIAHKIAELSMVPCIHLVDGNNLASSLQNVNLPTEEIIRQFLGDPDDHIESPTPAQKMIFGNTRRRIPIQFNFDLPTLRGAKKGMKEVADQIIANQWYFFEHLPEIINSVFKEFAEITGRSYNGIRTHKADDAKYLIITAGPTFHKVVPIVDYLRSKNKKVGCVGLNLIQPFPAKELQSLLSGKKAATVLEGSLNDGMYNLIVTSIGKNNSSMPPIFKGTYGVNGEDLLYNDVLVVYDNMLKEKRTVNNFYLGNNPVCKSSVLPKQEILAQNIIRDYPEIGNNFLPDKSEPLPKLGNSIAIKYSFLPDELKLQSATENIFGVIQHLYDLRITGKFSSDTIGYNLFLTDEPYPSPIEKEEEFDCIITSLPFLRSNKNILSSVKQGGTFILVSFNNSSNDLGKIPSKISDDIKNKNLKIYHLSTPDGISSQILTGLTIKILSSLFQDSRDSKKLFKEIEKYYVDTYSSFDSNIDLGIKTGYSEFKEIEGFMEKPEDEHSMQEKPFVIRQFKDKGPPYSQLSRFYNNTGYFYENDEENDVMIDPFQALSHVPSATANFMRLSSKRENIPVFEAKNCTGCGDCFVYCPHAAISSIALGPEALIKGAISIAASNGIQISKLTPMVKNLAKKAIGVIKGSERIESISDFLPQAFDKLADQMKLEGEKLETTKEEFNSILNIISSFPVAVTEPFFTNPEAQDKGTGELFSLAVNTYACTGCGDCAQVCQEDALEMEEQTPESLSRITTDFNTWEQLPDTAGDTITRLLQDDEYNHFASILLSRNFNLSMSGGNDSESGSPTKAMMHLMSSITECAIQPKIIELNSKLTEFINKLSENIHSKLSDALPKENFEALSKVIDEVHGEKLPIDEVINKLGAKSQLKLVDTQELNRKMELVSALKNLHWLLTDGFTGIGRSRFGLTMINSKSADWIGEYPYNVFNSPVLLEWDNTNPEIAIGLFKGHLRHQLDNIKLIRRAELEVKDKYDPETHDLEIARLDWANLSDREKSIIPPIILVINKSADEQLNLSSLITVLSGEYPIKVLIINNDDSMRIVGGPKQSTGLDLVLPTLALRNTYIFQSSFETSNYIFNGILSGIQQSSSALFNLYIPDNHTGKAKHWSELASLARNTRTFPTLCCKPDHKSRYLNSSLDLSANPMQDEDWVTETLINIEDNEEKSIEYKLTFADWAFTQKDLKHHFKTYEEGQGKAVPISEYLSIDDNSRQSLIPVIFWVDENGTLKKSSVSNPIIETTIRTLMDWNTLREIAGLITPFPQKLRDQVEKEMEEKHSKEIEGLKSDYETKLKEQERHQMEAVKKKLKDKLMALYAHNKVN